MHWEVKCVGIEKGVKRKGLQKGRSSEWEYFKDKVKVNTYEVNTSWSCEAVIDHEKWASMRWSDEINWTGILMHMMWTKMFDHSVQWAVGTYELDIRYMQLSSGQWAIYMWGELLRGSHPVGMNPMKWAAWMRWTMRLTLVGSGHLFTYEVDSRVGPMYQWASIFEVDNMRLTLVGRYGRGSILR